LDNHKLYSNLCPTTLLESRFTSTKITHRIEDQSYPDVEFALFQLRTILGITPSIVTLES